MQTDKVVRDERLEVRVSRQHKRLIEEAAALTGQQVSTFAISTLVERAEEVLSRHHVTLLSRGDSEMFLQLLDEDQPNERLRAAAEKSRSRRGKR